ncbi:MAG: hypothetical protein HQM03_20975 [Magnetococcales bacterium]|nr:hypothetical protein [Magnetococcales bacterium]
MSFEINPSQFIRLSRPTQPPSPLRTLAAILTIILITVTATVWHYHQSQPITDPQLTTLTTHVSQAAARSGLTRQKIWRDLHQRFRIHRARQLPRADFNAALAHLTTTHP